jgi:hypothetical protein
LSLSWTPGPAIVAAAYGNRSELRSRGTVRQAMAYLAAAVVVVAAAVIIFLELRNAGQPTNETRDPL